MSFDFAFKDVTRKWDQSKSYVKTIMIIAAIPTFFVHMLNGLGANILSGSTQLYNITTFDIFLQYFRLVVYFSIGLAAIWITVINHSIITHKTKDLATMKAVGTIQKKLNSFYITEVAIIDILGMIGGIFFGFLGYIVVFFIMGAFGQDVSIYVDFIYVPMMFLISIVMAYFLNGWELRRISDKRYAAISTGDVQSGYSAVGGLKLIPKWISRIGFKMKIAVTNLTRKKKQFYRTLITVSLSLTILITLTTGAILVGSTIRNQISGAQGENIVLIGHEDVVTTYYQRYEEFSDSSLTFTNQEYDFTDATYMFDESVIDTWESMEKYGEDKIDFWDKRFFVYTYAYEMTGYQIIGDFDEYQTVGLERQSYIPVVGIEYENNVDNWDVYGTVNKTDDVEPCALVGDTLAYSFFEAATYQSIQFEDGTTRKYRITGVFYDSFCAGNATYVNLDAIQEDFEITNQINLVAIQIDENANKQEIIQDLTDDVKSTLGESYTVLDLEDVFQQNMDSIDFLLYISGIMMLVFTFTTIGALVFYQSANFREKSRDYSIIRAIGGSDKLIRSTVFYEDLMMILIGMFIALGVSINFNLFFLMDNLLLPPFWVVLMIWGLISALIIILTRIVVSIQYRDFSKRKLIFLRVFDR